LTQQFVVVQQAPRDGILDGQHTDDQAVFVNRLKHILESGATD
jgi:hypothetical protein